MKTVAEQLPIQVRSPPIAATHARVRACVHINKTLSRVSRRALNTLIIAIRHLFPSAYERSWRCTLGCFHFIKTHMDIQTHFHIDRLTPTLLQHAILTHDDVPFITFDLQSDGVPAQGLNRESAVTWLALFILNMLDYLGVRCAHITKKGKQLIRGCQSPWNSLFISSFKMCMRCFCFPAKMLSPVGGATSIQEVVSTAKRERNIT